jgi:FkbH-like protein
MSLAERESTLAASLDDHPIKVVYLSNCAVHSLADILKRVATAGNMRVEIVHSTHKDLALISECGPDLAIVDPFDVNWSMQLWDSGARATDQHRLELVRVVKDYYAATIERLRPLATGRLVLLKGICAPALRPEGVAEFRRTVSFAAMARMVNEHICELLRIEPNMMFIDEQHIAATVGLPNATGTYVATYGSNVGDSPSQLVRFFAATAAEFLNAFVVWRNARPLKCVVADLDNTLWPGVVGEGGGIPGENEIERRLDLSMYVFGGIHQALGMLKDRGVLLATCSRNNREEVLLHWTSALSAQRPATLLSPEDFVLHEIGWDAKPVAMARILDKLGLDPAHVLFIDDDPIQRAQMQQAFGAMRIIGENLREIRKELLTEPRLQANILTEDALLRTRTARMMVERNALAGGECSRELLRSFTIELNVSRATSSAELSRVSELLKRTTQFNLTGFSMDVAQLRAFCADSNNAIFVLSVRDRFGDHGMVGACVVRDDCIENVVVSCRVISLEVAAPFLATCLEAIGCERRALRGIVRLTARNVPCRMLLVEAGFQESAPLVYIRSPATAPPVDPTIYRIRHLQ